MRYTMYNTYTVMAARVSRVGRYRYSSMNLDTALKATSYQIRYGSDGKSVKHSVRPYLGNAAMLHRLFRATVHCLDALKGCGLFSANAPSFGDLAQLVGRYSTGDASRSFSIDPSGYCHGRETPLPYLCMPIFSFLTTRSL